MNDSSSRVDKQPVRRSDSSGSKGTGAGFLPGVITEASQIHPGPTISRCSRAAPRSGSRQLIPKPGVTYAGRFETMKCDRRSILHDNTGVHKIVSRAFKEERACLR